MRERAPLAAGLAGLLLAACGGAEKPALQLRMRHVSRGTCPVTAPLGRGREPRRLAALAGPKRAARSFGKGGLWVVLPRASAPNAVPVHAGYEVRVPWFLVGSGDLRVIGERLDGDGRVDYDAYDIPGPGPRMEASALTISALGCYGIEAEHHGEVITWVFRASVETEDDPARTSDGSRDRSTNRPRPASPATRSRAGKRGEVQQTAADGVVHHAQPGRQPGRGPADGRGRRRPPRAAGSATR